MCVFVYRTAKLFLGMGRVCKCKTSGRPCMVIHHRLLMLLGQELTKILSKKQKIIAQEMDIMPRTMRCIIKQGSRLGAFKQQQENALPFH